MFVWVNYREVQDAGDGGAQVRDIHPDMAGQDQDHRIGENDDRTGELPYTTPAQKGEGGPKTHFKKICARQIWKPPLTINSEM